ncbi:MAG: hypothetical protein LBQ01_08770 [Prevotellaceae bacterium]|nr:hypothetical protein [Prevotellaceae bacterium]
MAKITNETFFEINDTKKFLDFLSLNMYEEENSNILLDNSIDEYIKDVINIIDFETNYEMEGLWTTYDNYNSTNQNNIENIIKSFNKTENTDIANLIDKIIEIYKSNEIKMENNKSLEQEPLCDELEKELRKIIEEKEYWNNVMEYIEKTNGIK